jgi:CheY-like chemotaxis protein
MAKILIIDDDLDITESIQVILNSKGHEVSTAPDGEEGISAVRQNKPDLIILDVLMPKMDGFAVARKIKSDENTKNIPILMLTAVKEKMGLDFKNEAGDDVWLPVDDYCEKPLSHEQLSQKIDKLLKN